MAKTWMLPFPDKNLGTRFGVVDKAHPNGHRGDDYNGLKVGTKLPAVSDGKIVLVQWSDILGNVAVLEVKRKLVKNVYVGYCHMQKPAKLGAELKMGETVGFLGNTGSASSGPHLHITGSYLKTGVFAGKVFGIVDFIKKKMKEEA